MFGEILEVVFGTNGSSEIRLKPSSRYGSVRDDVRITDFIKLITDVVKCGLAFRNDVRITIESASYECPMD